MFDREDRELKELTAKEKRVMLALAVCFWVGVIGLNIFEVIS